jgi:hypothetical protein
VAGEPGGEYLVDNLVGCPVWSEEAFFFPESLGAVKQPLYIIREGVCKSAV